MHADIAKWRKDANYFDFKGQQIAYWTGGSGKPLLLVHGFPTSAWDWVPVWEALGEFHRLIACDMLGFGLSDKPRNGLDGKGYSLLHQTDLHEALLAHLGISDWDALVHDYGVSVGQELLARQTEGSGASGLGQMVFLNGGIFPDFHRPRPIQKLGISPIGFVLGWIMNRNSFGKAFSEVFGPDTQPSNRELDEFWELIRHNGGHRIQHKLLRYMIDRQTHKQRWQHAVEANQDRIGLIDGALDPVSGEHLYRRWREVVPEARHHLLPHVGHYPQVEAADQVATKALEWLRAETATAA
ncbi:alpha/beta hydrolase [Altererythrobacter arenosus]|uniref:Alpha/beta hydrolase n=1 Tax=Altererythrobacter arenosus TaxID=3032592 RepID=A0ABY8FP52_9SPHN|nr:alpha/beta hydrolase [Altererythrobacter sp. CAU 1644]WFL76793.1 alpha/beta hydrolase [Altererythrobacter sp. CAU 1644]